MRCIILFALLFFSLLVKAQHCPLDCCGMLLVKTDLSTEQLYALHPVLTGPNKKTIVDSLFSSKKIFTDTCKLLYYPDFLAYRSAKIAANNFYHYDTLCYFAKGYYVIRVNFCTYRNQPLYIRFTITDGSKPKYQYVAVAAASLIDLHNLFPLIIHKKTELILPKIAPFIITIDSVQLILCLH